MSLRRGAGACALSPSWPPTEEDTDPLSSAVAAWCCLVKPVARAVAWGTGAKLSVPTSTSSCSQPSVHTYPGKSIPLTQQLTSPLLHPPQLLTCDKLACLSHHL